MKKCFVTPILLSLIHVQVVKAFSVRGNAASSKSPFNEALAKSPSESQVIEAAQRFMQNMGCFNSIDESLFSADFMFRGPVIGPLNKED